MKLVTSFIAVLTASAALACYASPAPSTSSGKDDGTPAPAGTVATESGEADIGDNPTLVPSQALAALKKAGVRIDLPLNRAVSAALAADTRENEHTRVLAIMHAFKDALGVECTFCHATKAPGGGGNQANDKPQIDFDVKTEKMAIAEHMWNDWVQNFKLADDGSQIFCDTCHQGKAEFLDRSDESRLKAFMKTQFASKLVNADGSAVHCSSCHGQPFDGEFLDKWAAGGQKQPTTPAE